MCIATLSIGSIITGIWSGILAAAEAVSGAVMSAASAIGIGSGAGAAGAGASAGVSAGVSAGAATAGMGAGTGATIAGGGGALATGSVATAGAGLSTELLGYSILGIPMAGGPLGTTVPAYLVPAAASSSFSLSSVPWGTIGGIGLTALGAGASVAGSLVGTVANMQNNAAQQDLMKYLAAQEEVNGILASRQGEHTDLQANQDRLQLHNKMLQTQGDARASFAARGVVLGSGTPNDYEADIADAYDLDSRNLEYDVAMKKWKYKVEAANRFTQAGIYRGQASAYRSAGTASLLGGMFGTAGSALSGLSSGLTVSSKLGWI